MAPSSNHSANHSAADPVAVEGPASSNGDVASGAPRKALKIATVSHTLAAEVAERLRNFAFRERMSESAVIEFALRELFSGNDDPALGHRLRSAGAALRRKSS